MRIKFTQPVTEGEIIYQPGDIKEVKAKDAKKYLDADVAIELKDEVTNGDG